MLKKILIYTGFLVGLAGIFCPGAVFAAKFQLSPANQQFIEGCDSAVTIFINTEGKESDAANIIIRYNPAEIDIVDANGSVPGIQISSGNTYDNFVDNLVIPSGGIIRLTGFSFGRTYVTGASPGIFGSIVFRGKPGVTATTLTIDYIFGSTTDSNIAEYLTSNDLLDGVTNGAYTFILGPCFQDTTPPYVTNISPSSGQTGVPLNSNITFHIKDNQAGVDISSLEVKVNGISYTQLGANRFVFAGTKMDYNVTVDPIRDFEDQVPVVVEIRAKDLDNNIMPLYRYSFNQPPVPPPQPPSCQDLGCADPVTCGRQCPTCPSCPEAPACPACPECKEGECPACPSCPAASVTCPSCPAVKECEKCPEPTPCPFCPTFEIPEVLKPLFPEISPPAEKITPPFPLELPKEITPQIPVVTVPKEIKLIINDFEFAAAYRTIPINVIDQKEIHLLADSSLSVFIGFDKIKKNVDKMMMILGESSYLIVKNELMNGYQGDFLTPSASGKYSLTIIINYQDKTSDVIKIDALVKQKGYVFHLQNFVEERIKGAMITLYVLNPTAGTWEQIDASIYRQMNPQISGDNGEYSFIVPMGKYLMTVYKEGYYSYSSGLFEVRDNIINQNIKLSPKKALSIYDVIIIIVIVVISLVLGFIIIKRLFKMS